MFCPAVSPVPVIAGREAPDGKQEACPTDSPVPVIARHEVPDGKQDACPADSPAPAIAGRVAPDGKQDALPCGLTCSRHCEARSAVAIQNGREGAGVDGFASPAMTDDVLTLYATPRLLFPFSAV
ncbi:MAG: hypothetical protein LBG78_03870 [Azoarcus sp.]|nr:hypothetical protein [Azoarcus sp.]